MSFFSQRNGALHAEDVPLSRIAGEFGTPCYVYSRAALTDAFRRYDRAFGSRPHLICYAVKANSNLAILNVFARLGSGFDIVSGGELARVISAGGDPGRIVFSGVGKTEREMRDALAAGILCFNVESESELLRLERIAGETGRRAPLSLRVNPNVDARTHSYISTSLKSKFGVAFPDAMRLYRLAHSSRHLRVVGIGCHIGSQLVEVEPIADAVRKILNLADRLAAEGIEMEHLDLGGGLGIRYAEEVPPTQDVWVKALLDAVGERPQPVFVEPGRSLVGTAGLLLTRVEYLKHGEAKNFAVVDAAMNDLIRPALYNAWHAVREVIDSGAAATVYDVVGPVCESGDFLAKERELAIDEGGLLAIMAAGAYGMSLSSNYNARPRAAEVMVDGGHIHLIRKRERVEDLYAGEQLLP